MATALEEKVQRGHPYAIVDEVDNILIDEARTPLIISGAPEQAANLYAQFARLARQMKPGKTPEGLDPRAKKDFVADFDFEFDEKHKTVSVTEQGVAKAEKFLGIDHLYRAENGPLVNHLIQALKAESLYKRDVDYAVIDDEVVAEAGRPGAVTIATNMACRGVDIKLGGNAEHQTELELRKLGLSPGDPDHEERYAEIFPAIERRVEEERERVMDAGGLFICGTERHESR